MEIGNRVSGRNCPYHVFLHHFSQSAHLIPNLLLRPMARQGFLYFSLCLGWGSNPRLISRVEPWPGTFWRTIYGLSYRAAATCPFHRVAFLSERNLVLRSNSQIFPSELQLMVFSQMMEPYFLILHQFTPVLCYLRLHSLDQLPLNRFYNYSPCLFEADQAFFEDPWEPNERGLPLLTQFREPILWKLELWHS